MAPKPSGEHGEPSGAHGAAPEGDAPRHGETTLVTFVFDAKDDEAAEALLGALAKYTVLARSETGARNVDLCQAVGSPRRFLLVEKWASPEAQRRHFDSPALVELAEACRNLLTARPAIELWDGLSAHDLA
jgi:quinol monooxygenase YgiN